MWISIHFKKLYLLLLNPVSKQCPAADSHLKLQYSGHGKKTTMFTLSLLVQIRFLHRCDGSPLKQAMSYHMDAEVCSSQNTTKVQAGGTTCCREGCTLLPSLAACVHTQKSDSVAQSYSFRWKPTSFPNCCKVISQIHAKVTAVCTWCPWKAACPAVTANNRKLL